MSINVYAPTNKTPKHKKQNLQNLKKYKAKIILNIKISVSVVERTSRQKVSKVTEWNNSINQYDLTDICRTIYLTMARQFFSSINKKVGYGRINLTTEYKKSLNILKRIAIMYFSHHTRIKLGIKSRSQRTSKI